MTDREAYEQLRAMYDEEHQYWTHLSKSITRAPTDVENGIKRGMMEDARRRCTAIGVILDMVKSQLPRGIL